MFAPEKGEGARLLEGDPEGVVDELLRILRDEEKVI